MGYTRQAVTGFGWQTIVSLATGATTALKLVLLARILDQREFGLFAYIAIALGLAEAITETGVNVTLIQAKESIKYYINTAWVIAIIRGLLIGIVMLGMGLGMSQFYNEPSLRVLVAIAALVPVIKGFINPAVVTFHKELRFFRDSVYRFSFLLVEAVLAVILAWQLQSVSALVFALIGAAVFEVIISFLLFKIRPIFEYLPNRAKVIFANAGGLSISAALSYIGENIDDLILGKILGTSPLGVYHTSYSLSHKGTQGFARALNHSAMPVFAKINHDKPRLRKAFLKSMTGLSVLLVAALIPLVFFPSLVVHILLGEKWLSVIPILPWLSIAGALQALTTICYTGLISTQSYNTMNFHRLLSILVFLPLFIWGSVTYGLVGAAVTWAVARLLTFPLALFGVMRSLR
jgi:O-antigen/teichoic acid export membrane protein